MPQEEYKVSVQSDGISLELNSGRQHKGELAVVVKIGSTEAVITLNALTKMIKALNYFKTQNIDENKS